MKKVIVLMMAVFLIPILSVVGKTIYEGISENYTFASTVVNLTPNPWLVPYARSMWWAIPAGAVIWLIIWFMRKEEPKQPSFTMPTQPSQPRQPRQMKQPKQPPPPMFIKR